MPHMSADDRLKAIREAEGDTVKATLAPHFEVHHDRDGLDRFGPAPMEDKRVYGSWSPIVTVTALLVICMIGGVGILWMLMKMAEASW